ncbi:hypothetical protein KKG58_04960 [Patescibacteria group bacterium]|nr:hypothetical protein [Patescibacteria group bacterium]
MYCQVCGNEMELLPDLHLDSSKQWYGCKKCNIVVEKKVSMGGVDMGTDPCFLSYKEYQEFLSRKEKEKKQ